MYEERNNTEQPVVSLRRAAKSYGGFMLGPVDLEVEPGYVVAVVGPNGSGKTTLFRMLMNLAHPDAGEVRVFGDRYPEREVEIKRKIGYVPETSTGHDELTALELGSFVSHWYPNWDEELYTHLLRRFEIDEKKRFDRLSKGLQRRLVFALAVALIHHSQLAFAGPLWKLRGRHARRRTLRLDYDGGAPALLERFPELEIVQERPEYVELAPGGVEPVRPAASVL